MSSQLQLSVSGSHISPSKEKGLKKMEMCTAEQAWAMLEEKFSSRYATVREAWIRMDTDKDNYISMPELKESMQAMGMNLSGHELRRLWKRFDVSGDGRISYAEFQAKVGILINPPRESLPMPRRPETPLMPEYRMKSIAATLRRKITSIEDTFRDFDLDGSGEISQAELVQALRKLGMRGIGDTESWGLMHRFKRADNKGPNMTLAEFKDCVTTLMKLPGGDATEADRPSKLLSAAEASIAAKLPRDNKNLVVRMLKQYDVAGVGDLTSEQFRSALDRMGVTPSLSDEQWELFWTKYDDIDDGTVGIEEFAAQWTNVEDRARRNSDSMIKFSEHNLAPSFKPWQKLGIRPLTDLVTGKPLDFKKQASYARVRHALSEQEAMVVLTCFGRIKELEQQFKECDKEHTGELSRIEFKRCLQNMGLDLDDMHLGFLVSKYDKNRNGRLSFREFTQQLARFMTITDHNLECCQLERIPDFQPETSYSHAEVAKNSIGQGTLQGLLSASSPAGKAGSSRQGATAPPWAVDDDSAAATAGGGASSSLRFAGVANGKEDDDHMTSPTSAVDLTAVAGRISKVLGKNAIAGLAAEVKAAAAANAAVAPSTITGRKQAAAAAAAGGKSGVSAVVPGSVLADTLAKKGVSLTPKEVRALSTRFGPGMGVVGGASSPSVGLGGPAVDVDKLVATLAATDLGASGGPGSPAAHGRTASPTKRR